MSDSKESALYASLGASSSKEGVHGAIGATERSLYFAGISEDVCGDPDYWSVLHSDGAGTKSILAYIAFRETGSTHWFESTAVDSLVMNLDDVACVNAFEGLLLTNTIGRNRFLIPDSVIEAIVSGYRKTSEMVGRHGVPLRLAGGETADVGDLVRTIIVDSSLFARVKRADAISTEAIAAGDVLIGLSSTGRASYEERPNSGIGSNGITLARHALVHSRYQERYPEIAAPGGDARHTYQGTADLMDEPSQLGMSLIEALTSPTRTYAPVIRALTAQCGDAIHGLIHCTGGGQSKICRFGSGKRYIKDGLFPVPPVFQLIQNSVSVPWQEMYAVFNMGHRLEIACSPDAAAQVVSIAESFGIEAQQIGRVENAGSERNEVIVHSRYGDFHYQE